MYIKRIEGEGEERKGPWSFINCATSITTVALKLFCNEFQFCQPINGCRAAPLSHPCIAGTQTSSMITLRMIVKETHASTTFFDVFCLAQIS